MSTIKEAGTGFHLLTRPTDEEVYLQIVDQTGLEPDQLDPQDLQSLYQLYGEKGHMPTNSYLWEKYLSKGESWENWQQIIQRLESLCNMVPDAMSYGLFIPSYSAELRAHRDRQTTQDGQHASLLLGAMTPDTVREYAITVRDVFPDAACHIVDVRGVKTKDTFKDKNIVDFRLENALKLSYADGSMDSVQTNLLLGHLKGPLHLTPKQIQQRLYSEASRVLKPDGLLLMVEEEVPKDIVQQLGKAGFGDVAIKPTELFINRRAMDRFTKSTASNPLPGTTMQLDYVHLIVARKKAPRKLGYPPRRRAR